MMAAMIESKNNHAASLFKSFLLNIFPKKSNMLITFLFCLLRAGDSGYFAFADFPPTLQTI